MPDNRELRVLIADDEDAIVRIYSMGLQHYFASDHHSSLDTLENELFGESEDSRPTIDITVCLQGVEAVQHAREAKDAGAPFDVIVLDIRMPPGIDGVDAARQIRKFDLTMPILFVSGYSDYSLADLQQRVPPPSLLYVIQKPVTLAELARKIKDITQ